VPHTQLGAELTRDVKVFTENVLKHDRFCCDLSCFEGANIAGLLPNPVSGLALPFDGRRS